MNLYVGEGYHCWNCTRVTEDPHWQDGKPLCRGCWLDWRDEVYRDGDHIEEAEQ